MRDRSQRSRSMKTRISTKPARRAARVEATVGNCHQAIEAIGCRSLPYGQLAPLELSNIPTSRQALSVRYACRPGNITATRIITAERMKSRDGVIRID